MEEFVKQIKAALRRDSGMTLPESGGHALVMQSGNRMAIEIGTRDDLGARLHDRLRLVGEGQKGGVVTRHIEDCVGVCIAALMDAGLSISFFRCRTPRKSSGGPMSSKSQPAPTGCPSCRSEEFHRSPSIRTTPITFHDVPCWLDLPLYPAVETQPDTLIAVPTLRAYAPALFATPEGSVLTDALMNRGIEVEVSLHSLILPNEGSSITHCAVAQDTRV
jgi:hypothetical protein